MWVDVRKRLPKVNVAVLCKLRHFKKNEYQEALLKKVNEGDCDWRTADDNSEINYDWNVVSWKFDEKAA